MRPDPFIKPTLIRARNDRGAYRAGASYARGDLVEYAGLLYLARLEHFTAGDERRTFATELAEGYFELLPDDSNTFLELVDTPGTWGAPGQIPRVNAGATGLEFYTPPLVQIATWLSLPDTPNDYVGNARRVVQVNAAATGVEFGEQVVTVPALPNIDGQYVLDVAAGGATRTWTSAPAAAAGLAANSVNTSHIVNGTITGVDIAADTITAANLAPNAVNTAELADSSVTAAKIASGAVRNAELGDDSVTSRVLANDAVARANIADNAVGALQLGDQAVTNRVLGNNAVTSAKIADGSINEIDLSAALAAKINASLTQAAGDARYVKLDGTSQMAAGYMPTADQHVVTKKFFDDNVAAAVATALNALSVDGTVFGGQRLYRDGARIYWAPDDQDTPS
ncbi:MAG: hypothetical protein ACR2RL_21715 [Gammaproteobacteria bacterium]